MSTSAALAGAMSFKASRQSPVRNSGSTGGAARDLARRSRLAAYFAASASAFRKSRHLSRHLRQRWVEVRGLCFQAGALKKPVRAPLKFERVVADRSDPVWAAADHKFAFTITRERNVDASPSAGESAGESPVFVARASCLDGSHRRKIGRKFKTFEAAARLCSNFTRAARRHNQTDCW